MRPKYFLALAFLVGLAIFGHRYHWLEAADSAERDRFVDKAELALHGQFPRDPFHPPLYVLLAAGLAPLVGGAFVGARTVSNLAACGFVLTAFGFGARLRDRRTGLWAMALAIANPNVWIFGEQAATDMLFACFASAALLAGLEYLRRPSIGAALAAGVAVALGAWVRGNAALLVPPLLLAYALPAGRRRVPAHLILALGAAVLVLAPLWWLRWRFFGTPFYDDNSRNLWWKLYAHGDWSLLERAPPSSFRALILGAPLAIVTSAIGEFGRFFARDLPPLMGWWAIPPLVAAVVVAIRARDRDALWLLVSLAFFTFGVAAVFFTSVRLMLIWIPIASALAIVACQELPRRWGTAASAALVAATLAVTSLSRLPAFVHRHPYAEVAALAPLDREMPAGQALAGTAPFLQRYLEHRYVHLTDETGLSGVDDYHDWLAMERLLRSARVKYVVVSDIELRRRPRALLGQGDGAPPPGLELIRRDAHVALWRVRDVP
ncbi:MAG TPA: glycosyltransferase family 39 protein [Polyangia bacterium]|nr:glycosyltransferase family 39 protein [Polyangia bacterium]